MDLKKFAADAGTLFNRAKQYTEEKLGQAEKTEFDAQFDNLVQRAEKTRQWTERMLRQTEAVLQPNPTVRMEEFFYEKLDRKKTDRVSQNETLGEYMIDAGNDFGPGTSYGSALVKCGQTQQKLGLAERDFISSAANNFLQPLKAFLDGDMKTVQKERKILETRRLDLDACKTRLRRAKSQPNRDTAEAELRVAQAEFDRQAEITKLLLEGISSTHAHHLRCLHDFVESQYNYYAQCQQYMSDLHRQLGSCSGGGVATKPIGGSTSPTIHSPLYPAGSNAIPSAPPSGDLVSRNNHSSNNSSSQRRARVLYDYDAADMTELSLSADEFIMVEQPAGLNTDWIIAIRGGQRGKVPITYIEMMD